MATSSAAPAAIWSDQSRTCAGRQGARPHHRCSSPVRSPGIHGFCSILVSPVGRAVAACRSLSAEQPAPRYELAANGTRSSSGRRGSCRRSCRFFPVRSFSPAADLPVGSPRLVPRVISRCTANVAASALSRSACQQASPARHRVSVSGRPASAPRSSVDERQAGFCRPRPACSCPGGGGRWPGSMVTQRARGRRVPAGWCRSSRLIQNMLPPYRETLRLTSNTPRVRDMPLSPVEAAAMYRSGMSACVIAAAQKTPPHPLRCRVPHPRCGLALGGPRVVLDSPHL